MKTVRQCTLEQQSHGESLLGQILEAHQLEGGDAQPKRRKKRMSSQQLHRASYHVLRAWDHQLFLLGKGLIDYKPYDETSLPLAPNELRYEVDVDRWADYPVPAGTPWKRFAIKNLVTKHKRFEIPVEFPDPGPAVLVVNCDECGSNLAPLQYMSHHLRMRVMWLRDAAHRTWRDYRLAVGDCDLWPVVYDCMHVLGLPQGPWHSGQWFKGMLEACDQHFHEDTHANPLFQALLPELLPELRPLDAEQGSQEEEVKAWEKLQRNNLLRQRGNRVTLTRWFEVLDRWLTLDKQYWSFLYGYCVFLWKTGVVKNVWDMPVWGVQTFDSTRMTTKTKQTGKRVTMREATAKEVLEEERLKCKNAVHLGANVLGQPGFQRRARVVMTVGRPVYSAFTKEQKGCYKEADTFKYQLSYALHGYGMVLRNLFDQLCSTPCLQSLRFPLSASSTQQQAHYLQDMVQASAVGSSSSSSSGQGVPCHPMAHPVLKPMVGDEADFEIAELFWNLTVAAVKHRGLSIAHYTDSLPGFYVLLLGTAENQSQALKTLAEWWEVLRWVEPARHKNPEIKAVFDQVGWLQQTVCREILVSLAQHAFRAIPPTVKMVLEGVFKGFANTILIERSFQCLRDEQRANQNKNISRQRRWWAPVRRDLLKDMGRKEVETAEFVAPDVKNISYTKSCFDALGQEPTWDKKELEHIMAEKTTWLSTSAQGLQVQVAAWNLLWQAGKQRSAEIIEHAWENIICPEGVVVIEKKEDEVGQLVLRSTCWGLLLWPMRRWTLASRTCWRPGRSQGTRVRWQCIADIKAWWCVKLQAVPPQVLNLLCTHAGTIPVPQIGMLQVSAPTAMLEMAARTGFQTCTLEYVDKILKFHTRFFTDLKPADRPKGLLRRLEWLVKAIIPEIDDKELKAIFLHRHGLHKVRANSLLMTSGNIEWAAGCMAADDLKDAETYKKNCHEPEVSLKKQTLEFLKEREWLDDITVVKTVKVLDPSSTPNPPSHIVSDAAKQKVKVNFTAKETELKKLLPLVPGCTIQQVLHPHGKGLWTGRYPNVQPASRSRSYGGNNSMTAAQSAEHVFRWIWKMHEAQTGQQCPHELEGGALPELA